MKQVLFDIETTHLNAFQGRIICISVMNANTKEMESCTLEDEKQLLEWTMEVFKRTDEVIGFNIEDFDIDFLIKRCLVKNVKVYIPKIVDLRLILGRGNKFSKGTMRLISSQLGFEAETLDGKEMGRLWDEKNIEPIKRHCEEDVLMSYNLYNRLRDVNLIK